jgi:hypothetical protein
MCLIQTLNDRTDDTGRICVSNMPFFVPETTLGEFEAEGVLGLAPSLDGRSYIE